jgi:putative effector of murein hydrolase
MKEAAGEANMTVVTIILIGIIVAVATPIVTSMMNNTKARTTCMNNGGYCQNDGSCSTGGSCKG